MAAMAHEGVMLVSFFLLSYLSIASSYRCSNRLYRGQRLLPGEHLCSRNLQYRMLVNGTNGQVNISESFPRVKYYKPPPPTLFITATSASVSQYLTVSDLGDFLAVSSDNSISWRANVTDGSFLELQDTGVSVLFAVNTTTNITVVKWKSPSQYSLRLAGGTTTAGRLEVLFNNTWGTVCNDAFDNFDAIVACKALGFQSGVSVSNTFGAGSGPIWLTKMKCRSTEDSLQQCAFNDDEKTWGDHSCTHSQDAAVNCTGSWTLGVPSPLQHVCVSRLYVGQTLAIGESLCGGMNGEYALRLTNKFGDTALVFEEKGKKTWMIGWKANTPAGVKATLGTDGVLRLIGSAAGLPYALFTQNITDAAFLDIQVDGTVKVVNRNGTVGWKKAANDYCYEEVKQTDNGGNDISNAAVSLMTCADSCTSDVTCKTFIYSDSAENAVTANCPRGSSCCLKKNGVHWSPNAALYYYEKRDGCSSGPSCYTFVGNMDNGGFDLASTNPSNVNTCIADCDSNSRCNNFLWWPIHAGPTCNPKWLRNNESRGSFAWDHFPARLPCTPVDPQSVSTTLPLPCPSKLQSNGYLLKGERLCSPSGQHVLSVEPDGRLLLDAGQWTTGSPSGTTAALHLTDTKLLLRLDDGSVKWSFDWSRQTLSGSSGYLELQDSGLLQLVNSFGFVIWNHVNASLAMAPMWSLAGFVNATLLVDGDNSSCLSRPSRSFIGLGAVPVNASFPVSLVGRNLTCDATNMRNVLTLMLEMKVDGNSSYKGRPVDCQLWGGNSTLCRFQCQSAATSTLSIALNNLKCGQVESENQFCEILLQ